MLAKSRAVKMLVWVDQPRGHAPGFLGARALLCFPPPIRGWCPVRLAQWARLLTPGRQGLRAGAWYSVVSRTPKEVQLTVRGRTVTIARSLVELRDTPPSDWTVVHPANARESYMVCPGCRHRAQLPERRYDSGRCPRCNAHVATPGTEIGPTPDSDRQIATPAASPTKPALGEQGARKGTRLNSRHRVPTTHA